MSSRHCIAFFCILSVSALIAREIQVNPSTGADNADGISQPVKTIARGLKLAQPGDTVHLTPGTYRESAVFNNRSGEPGKPIILDGRGAVLEGGEPLKASDWQEVAPGLFRNDNLLRTDEAVLQRWFFVFDGKMNHMGRTSKGARAALKMPEDLQVGEWTFLKNPSRAVAGSQQGFGSFYIKLEQGSKLEDAHIAAPIRSAGVQFSGKNSHIIVRNVTATHVYNDGVNIHGTTRDCRFENISSIDCGDDGFSAHEDAECEIDGFTSIGNSTGLCDTAESRTHYRNVFIKDCLAYDVFFVSHGDHSIENAIVESSALRAVSVGRDAPKDGICTVRLKNMVIRRIGGSQEFFKIFGINGGAQLDVDHCTIESLNVQAAPISTVHFQHCFVTGDPKPSLLVEKGVKWTGEANVYDVNSLRMDKTSFTPSNFGEFQKLTESEANSLWSNDRHDAGADEKALRAALRSRVP
jgi:Protein of unknown function (DUF1565)